MSRSPRRPFLVALWAAVFVGLVSVACNRVPYTGRRNVVLLSFAEEVDLGAQAYAEILAEEKTVGSGRKAELVDKVGRRLSSRTPNPFRGLE